MSNDQTGIFFLGMAATTPQSGFPKEFRKGMRSRFDSRFVLILAICGAVLFSIIGALATRIPVTSISDKEITRIQERYARLVLNQPKPKVEEKAAETKSDETKSGKTEAEEKKEEVKVDREKETFVDKQKRREATTEERRQKRDLVAKQVQSAGIFAAITAAGGSGGGANSSDLLGSASDGLADLGNISVSKGTFASRNVDPAELSQRKGARTEGVGIQTQGVGRASVAQVATSASVNITSQQPEVTGESASHADRSQSAIQRIVSREAQRLKRVYEDWLKRDPSLSGRLTVKFVILPSGAVSNVSIVKSTTGNGDFDETIVRYIKRWQFPPVPDGSSVEVIYPFVFEGLT